MAPELIVPLSDHFNGRVSYRGTGVFVKIKKHFDEFNLNEKARASGFGTFWEAVPLTFSSQLFHQVILHKMKVDVEKADEIHFYIGRNEVGWRHFVNGGVLISFTIM